MRALLSATYGAFVGSRQRAARSDGLPLESAHAPSLTVPIKPWASPTVNTPSEKEPVDGLTVWRCAGERGGIDRAAASGPAPESDDEETLTGARRAHFALHSAEFSVFIWQLQ